MDLFKFIGDILIALEQLLITAPIHILSTLFGGALRWPGIIIFGLAMGAISFQYNRRLIDWLRFQSLGTRDYIVDTLEKMAMDRWTPGQILGFLFAVSFVPASLAFVAFMPDHMGFGLFVGMIVAIVGWKAPKPIVTFLYQRHVNKFVLQMVDALSLLSNGMKSNMSMPQAMQLVVREMQDPLRYEFSQILSKAQMGQTMEQGFTRLAQRIRSDDVEMFVTSVNILLETGGKITEVFDTIVSVIRERIKVENKIAAVTAQGFYQGMIVAAIPPFLTFAMAQSDPEMMRPLFTQPIGWAVLIFVLALEVVGIFLIIKLVKIDV